MECKQHTGVADHSYNFETGNGEMICLDCGKKKTK